MKLPFKSANTNINFESKPCWQPMNFGNQLMPCQSGMMSSNFGNRLVGKHS